MNTTTGIAGGPEIGVQSEAPKKFPAGPGGVQLDAEVVSEPAAPLPQSPVGAGAVGTSAQPGVEVPPPVRFDVNLPTGTRLRVVVKTIRENWWRTSAVCATLAAVVFYLLWLSAADTLRTTEAVTSKKLELREAQLELSQLQLEKERSKAWWARMNHWK